MQLPISVQSPFFLRAASSQSGGVLLGLLVSRSSYLSRADAEQQEEGRGKEPFFPASVEVSQKLRRHFFIDFQEIKIPYKL